MDSSHVGFNNTHKLLLYEFFLFSYYMDIPSHNAIGYFYYSNHYTVNKYEKAY